MKKERVDIAIVGAGIAGMSFALYLSDLLPNVSILMLSKGALDHCNTFLAQGGIAAVMDKHSDSFERHAADTYQAGNCLGNMQLIQEVVKNAPQRIKDLNYWGVQFDGQNGQLELHQEGGHSNPRVVHCKDFTGKEIHQQLTFQLRQKANIILLENTLALDLLLKNGKCKGLKYLKPDGEERLLFSAFTVLASGGSGQLFPSTTNSDIATGDGLAMAIRAKVKVKDLYHVQFHPTALYQSGCSQKKLISEAVRGAGAYIVNPQGERFLFRHSPDAELACRDLVSKAIFSEMKKFGMEHQYLDIRHLDESQMRHSFPTLFKNCEAIGIHPLKELIPISPAAHYQCGGIEVDAVGKTSMDRLYAIGECTATGIHGNNRLASNSLLEALEFAYRAALEISQYKGFYYACEITDNQSLFHQSPSFLSFNLHLNNLKQKLQNELLELIFCTEWKTIWHKQKRLALLQSEIDDIGKCEIRALMELKNLMVVGLSLASNMLSEKKIES